MPMIHAHTGAQLVHLERYVDEEAFLNQRRDPKGDGGRFVHVLRSVMGRSLTYSALTT